VSKFIDRLKQVLQPAPQPMGFRPSNSVSSRPKIQLVANLSTDAGALENRLAVADAIILPASQHISTEIVWGIETKKGILEEVKQAKEAGADFVVLTTGGTVIPTGQEIGKILRVESSITDVLLRTINELPIDAVLIEDNASDLLLTWQRLMLVHRFAGFLSKSLLLPVLPGITAEELKLIWETGVSGVVIDISSKTDTAALKNLRQIINELPFQSPKKREKLSAVLPHIAEEVHKEEPDKDDDDDDED
jgi:hypothetical protein